jgi:MFS transporter, AAHS family, 4-hydroxybenzoate transporter
VAGQKIDVTRILEEAKVTSFIVLVLCLSTMLLFLDGYDSTGIAFAAPHIAREWHIAPSSFGTVFAVGPVGMLIGSIGFGYMGDWVGRKPAIISSTLCFGIAILLMPLCTSLGELALVRFISGLGIGGLFPLGLVLAQEFMPRRARSTGAAIANAGYGIGITVCGLIAATFIPRFGWPVVFWLGGGAAVLICPILWMWLPESIKFLVVKRQRPDQVARMIGRLKPGTRTKGDDQYFLGDDERLFGLGRPSLFALGQLFEGRLAWMTPLLWLSYVASSATVFFLSLWGPILVEALGVKPSAAAVAISAAAFGGLIASLVLARIIDRFGAIAIVVMPLCAAPLIASLGMLKLSELSYIAMMFVVGFFSTGGHAGLHSIAGIFYPSACRSTGTGWALSVSRLGTIGGPYIGGLLLAAHMPLRSVFMIAALPPLVFASSVFCLGLLHRRVLRDEAAGSVAVGTPSIAVAESALPT